MNADKKKTDLRTWVVANPDVVLQTEEDQWGILYNPNTDFSFGLNPVSAFIWEQMDEKIILEEIVTRVKNHFVNVSEEVEQDVVGFVSQLLEKGLAIQEKE